MERNNRWLLASIFVGFAAISVVRDAAAATMLAPGSRVVELGALASDGTQLRADATVCYLSYEGSSAVVLDRATPMAHGLGVSGGSDSTLVDGGEWLRFDVSYYASPPGVGSQTSTHVAYEVSAVTDGDSDGLLGEHFVQAFAADGTSLGVSQQAGLGWHLLDPLFGAVPVDIFEITAQQDGLRIGAVSYVPPPERPGLYSLLGLADDTVTSIELCGALLTSSNLLSMSTLVGSQFPQFEGYLGVLGGSDADELDAGEWIEVEFPEPMTEVRYQIASLVDRDGDGHVGEHFVEARDALGTSLGVIAPEGYTVFVSESFGDVPIQSLRITGGPDPIGLHNMSWTPVPEPAAAPLSTSALLAVAGLGRRAGGRRSSRKARSARPSADRARTATRSARRDP